ncbi:dicarboxylate/amino acid:cation symporter [uncultured Microscilla sp.]|uniref:dicarboxylate/amino acid:cation symporter n=1 Tax=uncultured Microscilla sp. TaxID=432653 RepID=UPI0026342389|nr:dicarboxylate/amino acid:cation symporter [uncultured Microscilla sp.]
MKKIALHWQILIALVLGVVVGLQLTPTYEVTKESVSKLQSVQVFDKASKKKQHIETDIIENLKKLEGKDYHNDKAFEEALKSAIGNENVKKYRKTILKETEFQPVTYVSWMGDIFLRALKMVIVPLILSSIITGITNIGSGENLGRLGGKTLLYYLSTSVLAITTGLFFVNLIRPGVGAPTSSAGAVEGLDDARGSFGDTLINMIPTNVFESLSTGKMLSIIFFAIMFGYFITQIQQNYKDLLNDFFNAVFEVMMKITMFIIKFTPLGVLGLVANTIAEQAGDSQALGQMAGSLGWYMLTVILGLGTHFFIILPLIVKFIGKANPFAHLRNMTNPLLTAFSTSSSSATLPLSMETVEHKSGVSNKITSFTLPLGATINMDGTALYECVAAMFIAQAYGIELSIMQQIVVVMTALLASIGAAGIPMAGLVMISVILSAVGLPLEGLGMILAVDRILDMLRTTTNVWSDSCGAVIIGKSEGEELKV